MVSLLAVGLAVLTGVIGLTGLVQVREPGAASIDVSALAIGAPSTVTELDLGKLKGDLRQVAWSSDGAQFYVQTAERKGKTELPHHYLIAAAGGAVTSVDAEPEWATEYWRFKSDRYAPGVASLVIDVKQSYQREGYGTGSAGAATSSTGSGLNGENGHGMSSDNIARAATAQTKAIVQLTLLEEIIGTWVDERPTPGTTFSWGPSGSGALVFTDELGRLVLLDNQHHTQRVSGTKDASFPAWSADGTRLAYIVKSGRNRYTLAWSTVSRR